MDKERNEEQEFLRDVERLLNGEEVTPGEDASEDARSAIEFVKKLTELRADPSPEFQERLKSRLLRRLAEQEVAARERASSGWFSGFLGRLIPQSPVWRTAVVTVAIIVVTAGVMWQAGLFNAGDAEIAGENGRSFEEMAADDTQKDWSQSEMAAAGEEEEEGITITMPPLEIEIGEGTFGEELEIEVEVSSSHITANLTGTGLVAPYGTEVTLVLTFRNTSSETVTMDPVQPKIVVKSLDDELVYILPAVDGPAELLPSESFQMLYVWEQQDNSGAKVVPGTYIFHIDTMTITRGTDSREISLPPVEVVILEP